jgi:cytochrome c-type biogenesis protein CcmH
MNALVILAIILSIGLLSAGGIYAASSAFRGLARTVGLRRTKSIAAGLVACLVLAGLGGAWYFASIAKQRATISVESVAASPKDAAPAGKQAGDLNVLVARLEERLRREPGDAQGLALYARTLMELGRHTDAAAAYANAVRALPEDAALRLEQADAAYMAGGQKWTATATGALAEGLRLAPSHPEALWLAGKERFENRDYVSAVRHWELLARVASPDSDYAREMRTALVEARALRDGKDPAAELANAGAHAPAASTMPRAPGMSTSHAGLAAELQSTLAVMNEKRPTGKTDGSRASILGTVTLDPAFKDQVAPEDIVFVFAKHADPALGAMPLAMLRQRIADLPLRFELSDNNAMSSDHKLSSAEKVIVVARVSRSGDAMPRNGDLEGASPPVANRQVNLGIAISRRR